MKKYIALLGLLALAGCTQNSTTPSTEEMVKEENTTPPAITTVYELPQSDIDALKAVFQAKHASEATDGATVQINMTLEKQAQGFARGSVIVGDPSAGVPGYLFLAAKKGEAWEIAFSGNGQINCEDLVPYNFPADMTADCVSNPVPTTTEEQMTEAAPVEITPTEVPAE